MKKELRAAVILSGCGHLDGTEIREAVLLLLELDRRQVQCSCFAPDVQQLQVVNHHNNKQLSESRNVLAESARIARGNILPLSDLKTEDYDALFIPGGFGVAKNFSNIAEGGREVLPIIEKVILAFFQAKKPIGAVCIAPALVALVLSKLTVPRVTLGEDKSGLIEKMGGQHVNCATNESFFDEENLLFSCSAYMRNDKLSAIHDGIVNMVDDLIKYLAS